jgi:hypothetical protein
MNHVAMHHNASQEQAEKLYEAVEIASKVSGSAVF